MQRFWVLFTILTLCGFLYFLATTNKLRIDRIKSDKSEKYIFKDVPFGKNPSDVFQDMFIQKSIR